MNIFARYRSKKSSSSDKISFDKYKLRLRMAAIFALSAYFSHKIGGNEVLEIDIEIDV